VPSSVVQPPPASGNGHVPAVATGPVSSPELDSSPPAPPYPGRSTAQPPASPLLAKLTSLTSIATVTAAGIIIVGILAVVGGSYAKQVVHDQLVPQKITFPAAGSPALLPGIKQYAGQQLVDGAQAKAYANNFINVHLSEVAGGKTYAQVATAALAAPTNATLATEKATLFQGETLRGLLLGAWGWSVVGTIASLAGWILILLGAILLALPLANWQANLRGRAGATAGA
jgi:putative Ca2+/H+ antiporter (TMEM165/GDT1 family)